MNQPFDLVGRIIAYEDGTASGEEVVELFQYFIDTGMAWTLQGRIGRTAMDLIRNGLCHAKGATP